jgi:hypothetical protein
VQINGGQSLQLKRLLHAAGKARVKRMKTIITFAKLLVLVGLNHSGNLIAIRNSGFGRDYIKKLFV